MNVAETYAAAQAFKTRYSVSSQSPPDELLSLISTHLEHEGVEPTAGAIKATLEGLGWILAMIVRWEIDDEDALMVVPERIADVTWRRARIALDTASPRSAMRAGVGAGFYTGLLMGLLGAENAGS